jgi:hypothetical protein
MRTGVSWSLTNKTAESVARAKAVLALTRPVRVAFASDDELAAALAQVESVREVRLWQ